MRFSTTHAVYLLAIPTWLALWHFLVGYNWLARCRLLFLSLLGCCLVLGINVALVAIPIVPDYSTELNLYAYVEQNAKTIAGFGLAIAVFVLMKFDKELGAMEQEAARKFLSLIFWSFLFAVMGCLPLYWVPPVDGWLTTLRHLKTIPYTYSLFFMASAISLFIAEMKRPVAPKKDGTG